VRRSSRFLSAAVVVLIATGCRSEPGPEAVPSSPATTAPPSRSEGSPLPADDDDVVVAAAGDIACDPGEGRFDGLDPAVCQDRATAELLRGADAVLALGDLQYEDGRLEAFQVGYERAWGRFAEITFPTLGNHELETPGAQGYFAYWGRRGRPTGAPGAAWYSFDLGSWHLIALDSTCGSACAEAQDAYLERDLAENGRDCVLAFWHHPRFNSGSVHGEEMPAGAFWEDLFAARADVVVNGHEHNYQRYAKQSPSGQATDEGLRQFVVGTGGSRHYGFEEAKDPNFRFGDAEHFGVLRLHLGDGSYTWQFVGVDGRVLDRGGPERCNG
jgi:hypothetical protein